MKNREGNSNLTNFNEERTKSKFSAFKEALTVCTKRSLVFASPSALALYLQDVTGINRTTLMRSSVYRRRIDAYLLSLTTNPRANSSTKLTSPVTRQHIHALRFELAAVKAELNNCRSNVAAVNADKANRLSNTSEHKGIYEDFSNTAIALLSVLERLQETIHLDYKTGEIVDLAARPSDRVIVDARRTRALIDFINRNPHVARLLR